MSFDFGEKPPTPDTQAFGVTTDEVIEELFQDKDLLLEHMQLQSEEVFAAAMQKKHYADPKSEAYGAREYILSDIPTPKNIKQLAQLPFEISITEQGGRLILSTGTIDTASHIFIIDRKEQDLVNDRHDTSDVSLHTHPGDYGEQSHVPSPSDLLAALDGDPEFFIASTEKLVHVDIGDDITKEELLGALETDDDAAERAEGIPVDIAHLKSIFGDRLKIDVYDIDSPEAAALIKDHFTLWEDV